MRRPWRFAARALVVVAVVAACGDDGMTTGSATSTGTGGGAPGTFTFTLNVQDAAANLGPRGPFEGARVNVDLEDGTHLEGATDANGDATFTIDEGKQHQKGDILVYDEETSAFTAYVDQPIDALSVAIWLFAHPEKEWHVSGAALGMTDTSNVLSVFAPPSFGYSQAAGADFSLYVPQGVPVTLMGIELAFPAQPPRGVAQDILGWTSVELPALDANMPGATLDFGQPITPIPFEGSFPLPEGAGPLASVGGAYVLARCLKANCGIPTRMTLSPDGRRFEFTGERLPFSGKLETFYYIGLGQRLSAVRVDGAPDELGALAIAPVELPEVIEPTTQALAWGAPVEWAAAADTADMFAGLVFSGTKRQVGRIFAPVGSTRLRWPTLPAAIDADRYADAPATLFLSDVNAGLAISGPARNFDRYVQVQTFLISAP